MQDTQVPMGTGFGSTTTADEVMAAAMDAGVRLEGKLAVVTGGYSGLGLEVVRVLAGAGVRVIVPGRDAARAAASLDGVRGVEREALDLADPDSIAAFSDRVLDSGRSIDVLINNAGVMAVPHGHDARGYETHFAVNHLGHADLTSRLWPALVDDGGARVVGLTSRGYRFSPIDYTDPTYYVRAYDKWAAYGQSMTAKAMFAIELDRRARDYGVRSFAVHPGTILTGLARHLSRAELVAMGAVDEQGAALQTPGYKTIAQGAATTLWAAISPQLDGRGGLYLDDVDVAALTDSSTDLFGPGVDRWLVDPDQTERLWRLTNRLLHSRFLTPLALTA